MITLPIMFMTESQEQLDELGIEQEFTSENTDIREVSFYNINFIYPSSNKQFTIIGCNGETLCCPKSVKEVSSLINQKRSYNSISGKELIKIIILKIAYN